MLPTGVGQQRIVATGNIIPNSGQFLPDSKHLLFVGYQPGHASRVYVMDLAGGQPRPITPEGFGLGPYSHAISPDGKRVAVLSPDGIALVPLQGGEPQLLRGVQAGEVPLHWGKSGDVLFLGNRGETSCTVTRLDVNTGGRTPWKTFSPSDVAGVTGVRCPDLAADEQHYAFGYIRNLSDLFLVEHLH